MLQPTPTITPTILSAADLYHGLLTTKNSEQNNHTYHFQLFPEQRNQKTQQQTATATLISSLCPFESGSPHRGDQNTLLPNSTVCLALIYHRLLKQFTYRLKTVTILSIWYIE